MNRSKEFERQRIELLSVEERIRLALSLRERFAGILQNTRADDHDGAPNGRHGLARSAMIPMRLLLGGQRHAEPSDAADPR